MNLGSHSEHDGESLGALAQFMKIHLALKPIMRRPARVV
jgi:hypothetical protein